MTKYVSFLFLIVLLTGVFLAGLRLGQRESARGPAPEARRILYFVDPMNPAHTSDKPGLAPCGMAMEAVYADEGAGGQDFGKQGSMPTGTVKIGPEKQQLIGIRMTTAESAPWSDTVRVLGRVVADETRVYRINAATDGWIKEIFPVTTGSLVKKDELLAAFYAPEFFSAMKAYLYGLRSLERFQQSETETKEQLESTAGNIENYRNSLRNLGMTEYQLDAIKRTKAGGELVDIRAPAAGFILVRNITLGERFQRGTELFRIADLSHVWIVADIFENESKHFQPGAPVTVTHPGQHRTFQGKVSEVLPEFDPATRTLKIRIELENPDYALRPDMFVDVDFPITMPSTLAIQSDAILNAGIEKIVFVDKGDGFFEPRQVQIGRRLGHKVEIINGLMPGERIVSSGNFFVDSESRMKMAAAGMQTALQAQQSVQPQVMQSHDAMQQGTMPQARQTDAMSPQPSSSPMPAMQHDGMQHHAGQNFTMTAKCPVCGMEVNMASARERGLIADYQGKTYYFCIDGDKRLFDKNPAQYVQKQSMTTAASSSAHTGI